MKKVHYVQNVAEISKKLSVPHSIFSVHGMPKTVMTETDLFKSWEGFGSAEKAYECLYLWKQQGWSGSPSSPVAFFRNVHNQKTNIKAGSNFALGKYFHGGWITNTATGFHHGDVYLYDIIKAYYWAGSLGLPTSVKYFRGKPNSNKFIAVAKIKKSDPEFPDFLQKETTVITDEDLETYNIEAEIIYGFDCYNFDYFPQTDLDKIDYLPPKCWKLASQSYWGIWAMQQQIRVERITRDGEIINWNLSNRHKKMIWAFYIIHRVTEKVWRQFSSDVLNIYVDSILTKKPIFKTGNNAGDWKLKNKFDGIVLKNSGVWTSIDNFLKHGSVYENWIKHAGYKARK